MKGAGYLDMFRGLAATVAHELEGVGDYLELLRDETWLRRDSAMSEDTIVEEVTAVLLQRHPDWSGREWIERGVGCLCAEHAP